MLYVLVLRFIVSETKAEMVINLAREHGVLRPRDLREHRIPENYLWRLVEQGILERSGRGLYVLAEGEYTEWHSLALACKWVPRGVVCLLTALRFHNLTTQAPYEVWMALERPSRTPRLAYPPLRVVRFSGLAFSEGIEEHVVEGVPVRVYSPGKTVIDCFRYRNRIGLDVALEALRECRRHRRATMEELWHFAQICRVANVMRPYMESLL